MSVKTYAWTTAQRLATFIGLGTLASGSTEEAVLERIIDTATETLEKHIGRRIKQTTYTNEKYDIGGVNQTTLILKNFPVISSESVSLEVRTSGQNEDSWEAEDTNQYFINFNTGIISLLPGRTFLQGAQKYRVSYTAGYDFNNTSTFLADTQAGDLEYLIWKLGSSAWERRKSGVGIKSERIGDYSVEYFGDIYGSSEIKEILDKYRRLEAISFATPPNT